jgi:hypothetical protein
MNKPIELNLKKPDTSRWREYVTFWNSESTLPICETSFQHYTVSTRRGPISCKSMLSSLELAYLHFLAKDRFSGAGAIVDLGPYCGVGTLAMASGLGKNPVGDLGRIYSFDLFLTHGYDWYFKDWELPAFGSVFPLFTRITEDYSKQIIALPGDLLKMRWNTDSIEILFVDIAKSPELNHWVVSNTFPRLIPGTSVVVQQDYVHFNEWWIQAVMEYYADRFQLMDVVFGGSAIFQNVAPISEHEAWQDLCQLPLPRLMDLMERAAERMPLSVREVMKCSRAKCLLDYGELAESEKLLDTVSIGKLTDDVATDFSGIAKSNLEIVRSELARKRG